MTAVVLDVLVRRLVQTIVLLAAVAMLSFGLGELAPGSYDQGLRLDPQYSAGAVAALRTRHGLDRPLLWRLSRWIGSLARGDFGMSIEYEAPVAPLVFARAGRTLLLGFAATSIAWFVAVPLGVVMAACAGSWYDRACRAGLAAALAMPEPVLALGLMMVAIRTGMAPAGGMLSTRVDTLTASSWATTADMLRHLALPVAVLTVALLPVLVRHVRASLVATLDSGFIAAARARGVPRGRLLFRSALRVAATPLLSLFGLSIANLLSASLLVEVMTGWPGLGPLLVEATRSRDVPVVVGVTLCSSVLLAVGSLVTDLAVQVADPRVRLAGWSIVE